MAIGITSLAANGNDADQANYATASISPTSGLVWLLWVNSTRSGSADPPTPTASGAGLTWTEKATLLYTTSIGRHRRITLFVGTGTPSAGAVTIAHGTTIDACQWDVWEITGAGTTDPVVGTPTPGHSDSSVTSAAITLPAAADSNNRPAACFNHGPPEATAPRANWTEMSDVVGANNGFLTQWRSDTFETDASATWTTGGPWGGIAIEIAAAAAAAGISGAGAIASGEAEGEPGARRKEVPEGVGTAEAFGSEEARRRVGADGVPGEETFGQAGTLRREGAAGVQSEEAAGEPAALRREGAAGVISLEAFGSEAARRRVGPDSILAPGSYGEGGYGENPYGTQFGIPTVSAAAAAIVGDLLTETQVSDQALDTVAVVDGTLYAVGLYHADLDTVTVASADLDTVGVATSVLTAVSVGDGLATDLDESASTAAIA